MTRGEALISIALLSVANLHAEDASAACTVIDDPKFGDCSGVSANQRSSGFLSVSEEMTYAGIIDGATITKGGQLSLAGISLGKIDVMSGGKLFLHGTSEEVEVAGGYANVSGVATRIVVRSGSVYISGTVYELSGDGTVQVEVGAFVAGEPRAACTVSASNIRDCPSLRRSRRRTARPSSR